MFLLVGATGRIGSRLARLLSGRDDVRALARSDAAATTLREAGIAAVVDGDLDRPETLGPALRGIRRLFVATPFGDALVARETALIDAAVAAGVERVVKLSTEAITTAAECSPGTLVGGAEPARIAVVESHAIVERHLAASPLEGICLRPTFIDHLLASLANEIHSGTMSLPAGGCSIALVHPEDVAEAAFAALTAGAPPPGPIHLSGPEAIDFRAVARRLTAILGHAVRYRPIANGVWLESLVEAGVPTALAGGLADGLQLYVERGEGVVRDDGLALLGHAPRPLDDWIRETLV